MKFFLVILFISTCLISSAQTTAKQVTENARSIKAEMRNSLGDLKYDGYKTTYYEVKDYPVFKEFEATLILRTSYTLFFSGEAAQQSVGLRIYDKPYNERDRTLLYEEKNLSQKKLSISTTELDQIYKKATGKKEKLKAIYVEYSIPKGTPDLGAIVLVFGY